LGNGRASLAGVTADELRPAIHYHLRRVRTLLPEDPRVAPLPHAEEV
jgi:hypothetical protein